MPNRVQKNVRAMFALLLAALLASLAYPALASGHASHHHGHSVGTTSFAINSDAEGTFGSRLVPENSACVLGKTLKEAEDQGHCCGYPSYGALTMVRNSRLALLIRCFAAQKILDRRNGPPILPPLAEHPQLSLSTFHAAGSSESWRDILYDRSLRLRH